MFIRWWYSYKQLVANSENAGRFVSDSGIKDVEVTRDGERNEVSLAAPDVSDLLMIDSSPKCPCCSHFAGFNVPLTERCKTFGKNRISNVTLQSLTVQSAEEVNKDLLSGLHEAAI